MPDFDERYWNLTQAAAWVVYRKRKLVEEFSEQSVDAWRALILYPGEYEPVGKLDELVKALTLGKLTAWGRRNEFNDKLEAIPAIEWTYLWIIPPSVKRRHHMAGQIEPWIDLRFESSGLKKRWRSLSETEGRTRYKRDVLEKMWHEIVRLHPKFSKNEKIRELRGEYKSKYGSSPSRSLIQLLIEKW